MDMDKVDSSGVVHLAVGLDNVHALKHIIHSHGGTVEEEERFFNWCYVYFLPPEIFASVERDWHKWLAVNLAINPPARLP